jgi:hypothetical protein
VEEARRVATNEDALARMLGERFVVLTGHRAPGSRAAFPAIAIGPAGVFVIEESHARGRLRIRRDVPFLGREPVPGVTQRVRRHALALQLLLGDALSVSGLRVTPVLWVREARLGLRRLVGGVHLQTDRSLRTALRRSRPVLPEPEVAALIRLAEARLIPLEGKSA